mmetsp:Transcript_29998/g.62865  ORF Transcript_29998/g.62865 Transcript_29998/m.62865 type:complete len:86 (+) Transcript_29998:36-293(+)
MSVFENTSPKEVVSTLLPRNRKPFSLNPHIRIENTVPNSIYIHHPHSLNCNRNIIYRPITPINLTVFPKHKYPKTTPKILQTNPK